MMKANLKSSPIPLIIFQLFMTWAPNQSSTVSSEYKAWSIHLYVWTTGMSHCFLVPFFCLVILIYSNRLEVISKVCVYQLLYRILLYTVWYHMNSKPDILHGGLIIHSFMLLTGVTHTKQMKQFLFMEMFMARLMRCCFQQQQWHCLIGHHNLQEVNKVKNIFPVWLFILTVLCKELQ